MRVVPLGETAWLLRELDSPAFEVAAKLQNCPDFVDVVACYETVGVYFNQPPSLDRLEELLQLQVETPPSRTHTIPVCYERGEDLQSAANQLQMPAEQLVAMHTGTAYRCFAVGFCPGFPYLGYLPDAISGLPRLASPRVRVPAGSVAITGKQTGIYPLERPGGWWLLGQTPLCLVDVEDSYFPIEAGDTIQFQAIDQRDFLALQGERL